MENWFTRKEFWFLAAKRFPGPLLGRVGLIWCSYKTHSHLKDRIYCWPAQFCLASHQFVGSLFNAEILANLLSEPRFIAALGTRPMSPVSWVCHRRVSSDAKPSPSSSSPSPSSPSSSSSQLLNCEPAGSVNAVYHQTQSHQLLPLFPLLNDHMGSHEGATWDMGPLEGTT